MSGITTATNLGDVSSLVSAWQNLVSTVKGYSLGNKNSGDVTLAASAFSAAAAGFSENAALKGISSVGSFVTGIVNLNNDIDDYNSASDAGDSGAQANSILGMVSDAASAAGPAALAISPTHDAPAPPVPLAGASTNKPQPRLAVLHRSPLVYP